MDRYDISGYGMVKDGMCVARGWDGMGPIQGALLGDEVIMTSGKGLVNQIITCMTLLARLHSV